MEGENGLCYAFRGGDHSFEGLEADTYFSNCPMNHFAIMCLKTLNFPVSVSLQNPFRKMAGFCSENSKLRVFLIATEA